MGRTTVVVIDLIGQFFGLATVKDWYFFLAMLSCIGFILFVLVTYW